MASYRFSYGFTYIGLLLAIAMIGISMAVAAELWQTTAQREKEAELLFIGHQFRDAIEKYYKSDRGSGGFPEKLEDLLQDPNVDDPTRYLRKIYRDPMTGSQQWGLVRDEDSGEIRGVFSLSTGQPIKRSGFDKADVGFTDKLSYAEWKFIYNPDGDNP